MNRFPIRLRILLAVVMLLTVTVAVITASMARLFSGDKIAYVNDVAAIVVSSTATESAALLRGYLHGMDQISAILADTGGNAVRDRRMSARLLARLPEFLTVSLVTEGMPLATLFDAARLAALGLSGDELAAKAFAAIADLGALPATEAADVQITRLTLPGAAPMLVLALPLQSVGKQRAQLLVACLDAAPLAQAVERGRGFRSALVNARGDVLVESASTATGQDWNQVLAALEAPAPAGVVTRDVAAGGTDFIAARAGVHVGGMAAITVIPRAAAYLTARRLLDSLMAVSLVLIACGALVALLVSRRLTKPIEELAAVAERIGKGHFDARIGVNSADEIGALAASFNGMAAGLQERERALAEAQQALVRSEKMSAFGQLSAGIAHEVKNPLAGILGHAQLAMRRLGSQSAAQDSLELIATEARRCNDIISNLMRFARQDKPQFLPVDINAVARAAMAIVDHQLALQGIRIAMELATELPPVEGDANQLQQVLVNLAINAQQALAGTRGELRLCTRAAGEQVVVEVQDTGPGMPSEVQARIFEPFFTTKSAGEGTGLGLSVSYGIIESHGGRIEVRSSPGAGATFIISLPAAAVGRTEAAA